MPHPLPRPHPPNCTPLLFISNFWALGYFAVFQSPHYYYLVDDLDMQSKGHAICATLVSESNAFSMMPRLKPCNCVPGELWLKFSQYTSKNVLYPHCAITPYYCHCQDKNGTYQNNYFDVASTNISMWMAVELRIIIRRGFGQEKRIKKWLNIILMGRNLQGFHTVYLPCY